MSVARPNTLEEMVRDLQRRVRILETRPSLTESQESRLGTRWNSHTKWHDALKTWSGVRRNHAP